MSDGLQRFLFEQEPVRGEFVHLETAWQALLARTQYPPVVRDLLGEAVAAAVLMAATVKFDGTLTLQIQAAGPVHLLVVQVTADQTVRGLARWQAELPQSAALADLCGEGTLVMTIDDRRGGDPYQGVVSLGGGRLADALEGYFQQSEQLPTRLHLAANAYTAAGLMLQRVPGELDDADLWNRVTRLGSTVSADELLSLPPETLMHRLYHEETLRVFEPASVAFRCRCSRERIAAMIVGLGADDARALVSEQGEVAVDCEFCGAGYRFDAVDVEALLSGAEPADPHTH